jgi:3-oxoacyl-[acyl-carrier protein] reductase
LPSAEEIEVTGWLTMLGLLAVKRYGHADEIAAMTAYLAGPEARYITGASLLIDGGFAA